MLKFAFFFFTIFAEIVKFDLTHFVIILGKMWERGGGKKMFFLGGGECPYVPVVQPQQGVNL